MDHDARDTIGCADLPVADRRGLHARSDAGSVVDVGAAAGGKIYGVVVGGDAALGRDGRNCAGDFLSPGAILTGSQLAPCRS